MSRSKVSSLAPVVADLRSARVGRCQAYLIGELAQLGEHLPYKQRVGGSNPSFSTIYFSAGLAQLVEQLTCNQ